MLQFQYFKDVYKRQGYGRTMELKVDDADPAVAENWFAGCIGGSPGTPYIPCIAEIIFSEINYNSADTADAGDWIEIQNYGPLAVDLSGWVFSDDDDDHLYTCLLYTSASQVRSPWQQQQRMRKRG